MSYFRRILLLPTGSFEYHGTELPPDTDTRVAVAIARSAGDLLTPRFSGEVTQLPPLTYGLSAEHIGLPTTASVSHQSYWAFITELLDSLAMPADLLVLVNGHGGNIHTLEALEADFNYRHHDRKLFVPPVFPTAIRQLCTELFGEFDAHAGSVEASLVAFYEKLPKREYVVTLPRLIRGTFRFLTTAELNKHGVIKKLPTVIVDPAKGSTLHGAVAQTLADSVMALAEELGDAIAALEQ